MKSLLDKLLKESLCFPYCSATSFYHLDGIDVPEKFGSNCYEQSKRLKNTLSLYGYEAAYLEDTLRGRHRGLIVDCDEGEFYMDPYLMHDTAILIDDLELTPKSDSSGIYQLKAVREGNIINVEKSWDIMGRKDSFSFDCSKGQSGGYSFDEYTKRALHPEQKTLSIRAMDPSGTDILYYIFDIRNNSFCTISSSGIAYGGSEFDEVLHRMASCIGSTPCEIEEYILEAAAIRKRIIGDLEHKTKMGILFGQKGFFL